VTPTEPAEVSPTKPAEVSPEQASATMHSRPYLVLLALVAVIGVAVSLAAWCFLELVHQIQQEVYTHIPHALGYSSGAPRWWPLIVLPIAALITAIAIVRLPGGGGHIPAEGLATGGKPPTIELPGVLLAAFATIGLGLVLGPEAPLIALGSGLAAISLKLVRRDPEPQTLALVAAAGTFAALSFVFSSPLIAAVILIEAAGFGGARLRLVLVPGMLAAAIGSLVSIGMGSFTGLSSSAYALSSLPLAPFGHPHVGNFAWTIALSLAIAVGSHVIIRGGLTTYRTVRSRPMLLLPLVGLIIAGLAAAFSAITGKGIDEVLFSGQDQLPGLVAAAGSYSAGALALVLVCKGIAYGLSLGSFRGGPTFPILFLGAAAGILASRLPGFPLSAAVAVGMAAGMVAVLKLPLTAVVTATVLTEKAGAGVEPLIIVGVVVSYITILALSDRQSRPAPLRQ
jgi:H+/Cl- antiporter ClcA